MNTLVYPEVVAALAGNPEALQAANAMDPSAGECMRLGLERMMELIGKGYINLEKCGGISDNYTQVILRFFEGDVPCRNRYRVFRATVRHLIPEAE